VLCYYDVEGNGETPNEGVVAEDLIQIPGVLNIAEAFGQER
jgi:hypothetical protein